MVHNPRRMTRAKTVQRAKLHYEINAGIKSMNREKRLLKEALINAGVDPRRVNQASLPRLRELADSVGVSAKQTL